MAAKVGSPGSRDRSTRVLTKKPIKSSTSGRCRFATGVPTVKSRCPVSRASRAWKPARSTMKSVASHRRASSRRRAPRAASRRSRRLPAERVGSAGRGRSAGRRSPSGAPASSSFHQASCAASRSGVSEVACQTAWSATWMGSGGRGDSLPAPGAGALPAARAA
jgi:hypothetical protein